MGVRSGSFWLNGQLWTVKPVPPGSDELMDRTRNATVATTDPATSTVYISDVLAGDTLKRVMVHEICHCALVSYGLLDDIRQMVYPSQQVYAQEWACNWIADYAPEIITIAQKFCK